MKKLKLLSSLSVLCLALSILCVGVFSLPNVTYAISGIINYEIEDVYCQITTKVYKVASQRSKNELENDVATLSSTSQDKITYTLSQDKGTFNSYTNSGSGGATNISIDFNKDSSGNSYYTYYIVVNVENLSTVKNMRATLSSSTTSETNVYKAVKSQQQSILKGEKTRNIVIAYSLADVKLATELNFKYVLTVDLESYNLSFNTNGGTVSTASKKISYNGTFGTLPTPTKSGYNFNGWMLNEFASNTEIYRESAYIGTNGAITSYGEYTIYKLPLKTGKKYVIINSGKSSAPGYAIYDSSGKVVASKNYANTATVTFTAPSNASYILFSVVTNSNYRYDKDYFSISTTDYVTSSSSVELSRDIVLVADWTKQ